MSIIQGSAHTSTGGYQIERSLRFNSADSAYLNRTPGSASNRKTWTWSGWVKRSNLGTAVLFSGVSSGNDATILRFTSNQLQLQNFVSGSFNGNLITTAVYRDVSSWYHIVAVWDSANATSGDRMRLYVNGSEVTVFSTDSAPTQNTDGFVNNTNGNYLGVDSGFNNQYFNGYMTEVNFIDGQALTPSSFGETDSNTGVWKPKAYSGTYGTNGFFLKFADNSNTTAATLGKDSSGNGNNWTPNNFSVTAGAGNDSLVDSPTAYGTDTGVGGSVRGNYCTLNPLSTTAGTYTQGNLRYVGASAFRRSNGTLALSTGKWYWEVTLGANPEGSGSGNAYHAFGFGLATVFNSTTDPSAVTDAVVLADNNYYKNFSGSWTSNSTSFASGDVLSIAVDLDANTFTFRKNNSQLVTGTIGGTAGRELVPIILSYSGSFGVMDCNFGQRAFAYTAPSGFKALCTQNLTTPAIGATSTTQAGKYFNAVARNGYGTGGGTITTGFYPDFIWEKQRNGASDHYLVNTIAGGTKTLSSNKTAAEATDSNWISAFSSTGYTHGSSDFGTGDTVAVWAWNANSGSSSSNTSGTITSTVSANTTAGFSIVTFTTDGTTKTVGHGLGAKPSVVIVKSRNSAGDWLVITDITGSMQYGALNSTSAFASIGYSAPTSTVFSYNDNNGNTQVAYCFAPVAGYSAFGTYTGNSSTDGPFVYLGFRPRYVLIRKTNSTGNWQIQDTTRTPFNWTCAALFTDSSAAEVTTEAESTYGRDYLSNGMKIRASHTSHNNSGDTYMYMAFAESPFKYALAR